MYGAVAFFSLCCYNYIIIEYNEQEICFQKACQFPDWHERFQEYFQMLNLRNSMVKKRASFIAILVYISPLLHGMDRLLQKPADCPTAAPMEMQISAEIYTDVLCTDIMQSYEMLNSLSSPADRLLNFKPLHLKIKTLKYEALTQERRIALATILFTTAMQAFDNNYLQLVSLYYLDAIDVLTKGMSMISIIRICCNPYYVFLKQPLKFLKSPRPR